MKRIVAFACVFIVTASSALAHTLTVPFFFDNGSDIGSAGVPSTGTAAVIAVKNTTTTGVVMNIVYSQPGSNGQSVRQGMRQFTLAPRQGISWRPVQDDPGEGGGRSVPNVQPGFGAAGSVEIVWVNGDRGAATLTGRYVQITNQSAFAHVLQ